jgi:hypothetical protein
MHLVHRLGLTSEASDPSAVLAWLEGQGRGRIGLVVVQARELLEGPAEEQRGFMDWLERLLQVGCLSQQQLLSY